MSFVGHAFVDWDDTIAENIRYFNQTEEANSQLIARLTGHDAAAVLRRGQELDLAVARRMGLVRESLSVAWLECYREFARTAGMKPDAEAEAALQRACQMPYEVRQELIAGAAETLTWLHQSGFEVTIWTAGDEAVQTRKIRESGLKALVHRAQVVVDKTAARLKEAVGDRDLGRCFVVGNSLHSDIRPALALGVTAVHVPAETWAYDQSRVDLTDPAYHRVERLTDLPDLLSRRFALAGRVAGAELA